MNWRSINHGSTKDAQIIHQAKQTKLHWLEVSSEINGNTFLRSGALLQKLSLCNHSRTSLHFMVTEGSSRYWQEPSNGHYPEPDRSSPYHPVISRSISIFRDWILLCIVVIKLLRFSSVKHNNIPINSFTYYCARLSYWSYNFAICFGSWNHLQAIHQQSYTIELCILYGSIYLSWSPLYAQIVFYYFKNVLNQVFNLIKVLKTLIEYKYH
jgi:hypothetical protein